MADSQSAAKVFSTRIVTMDYYMAPPIPDFDICYSSFQGGKVNEVPVIRIYGPTPAGQKACLHIHKALPYLYIPFGDLVRHQDQEGSALAQSVCLAIEKALKLKGNAGSKRQHVHSCTVVRAKKFYGYHSSEELFMKIQLYHPQDISRVSSLLLAGAVLDKILQPYESHIPFLLQFLIDYNLYGMGHIHFSKIKFRHPVPEVDHINKVFYDGARGNAAACSIGKSADSKAGLEVKDDLLSSLPIWTFGTFPADWIWPSWNQSDVPSAQDHSLVKRQSHSELEGDAVVEDILNQLLISYTPLSQSISGVKMVQSLVPIWEEELQRSGIQGLDVPPNTAKPLPEDVLKILSNWSDVENLLMEKSGVISSNSFSEKHVKSPNKTQGSLLLQASADSLQISNPVGPSNAQPFDQDALGLLKWLASSQAVEEINSDDELARETILSPLLPTTAMAKLLEKASMDFECLSQQECQDILDSVIVEGPCEGVSTSDDNGVSHDSLSNKTIPQVDGSADDFNSPTYDRKPSSKITSECGISADDDSPCCSSSPTSCGKRKTKRWGSLPFSLGQSSNSFSALNSGNGIGSFQYNAEPVKTSFPRTGSFDHGRKAASSTSDCSMRELMRKKRCYRTELPDCRLSDITKIRPEKEQVLSSDAVLSGSHTPGLFIGGTSNIVVSKSPHDTEIPVEKSPETSNWIPMCGKVLKGSSCIPDTIQLDKNHEIKSLHPGYESSETSICLNSKPDSSGLIAMTLCQKPPVMEFINGLGSSVTSSPFETHDHSLVKERDEGMSLQPGRLDDLPPFFTRDHLKGNELSSVCCSEDYFVCGSNKGVVMGVPIHYLNDGSHLYMLSPVNSPPSRESVKRWLLDRGTSVRKSIESEVVLPTSPRNLSDDPVDSQGCLAEDLDLTLPGSSLESGGNCNLNVSSKHDQGTCTEDVESHHNEVKVVHHKEGSCSKSKQYCSQEMSQLSGPDSKSKLTPLSQIGFRDPASVSGTQQLTILSIEVVAESRGDLRPDPRFDAVNIIALVIQADDDPKNEAFILLRSGKEASEENVDGICECKVLIFQEEKLLFSHFVMLVSFFDPDMLMGWDVQGSSLGFLAERAAFLGIGLLNELSRTPSVGNVGSSNLNASGKEMQADLLAKTAGTNNLPLEDAIIDDEWGRTHASGVHVGGRIVLNIWRLMRNEVKLNMYTVEAVAEAVLRRKIPFIPYRVLTRWFSSGPGCARYRCVEYVVERAKLNLRIMNQLDMINRTSELARVFGIDFFSVLSRGSQYRVESMFLRLAHTQNYLAISPGSQQVAYQPAMECLPLVMEPESGFYADPVVVLDFQSLYPSMIIAYNLCFSTCLGKIVPSKENTLGVSAYLPDRDALESLKEEILVTPNGVMYVPSKVRKGILPRLLEEILSTRIMIKQAMKRLDPSQQVLHRIFNARQLALKLIANVTYGYTAAGFSGRMPCAELADSIVQCARRTLEHSILFVNNHDTWKAKVVYGDTDSMFVLLKGRSRKEAFKIGAEIAAAVCAMNPDPVVLKMEKVYHPCFLLAKKRYAGYSYESSDQIKPKFDAKGIETVRRDTCAAVSKTMEQTLRIYFEQKDIDKVKDYLLRQWKRIMSGRISLQDFIFAKEVRLGTYSARASSLPPGAIIATKAMKADPRAEPRYAERIPYVVVHGEPGARLVDMVVDPLELLVIDSPFRLNDVYYIRKQIIPALQRVFGLVGADLNKWYSELPRPERESLGKRILHASSTHRTRIDFYYLSRHCILCGALVHASSYLCRNCSVCEATLATILTGRTAKLEKNIQHLVAICRHCGGGDWVLESGVKCTSLACSIFYERRKVQKELQSISAVASEAGFYPTCMAELF